MATAKGGYFTKDKQRVPSVTTILSRFKESGALMYWAWDMGKQGKDFREERDKAASSGTLAHDLVERWIKNEPLTIEGPEDVVTKARQAFDAFQEWASQTQLKVTHTELPLVSERYRFGGTLDAMLVNGKLALGDWKTSNAIYADYLMQVAAYGILWEEAYPDQPINGGYHILRFAKEYPDFEHRYYAELNDAREMFIHLRAAYDFDQKLKKRVR